MKSPARAARQWIERLGVKRAGMTIDGLPVGSVVQFRRRVLTRAGMNDWSGVISLLIK